MYSFCMDYACEPPTYW